MEKFFPHPLEKCMFSKQFETHIPGAAPPASAVLLSQTHTSLDPVAAASAALLKSGGLPNSSISSLSLVADAWHDAGTTVSRGVRRRRSRRTRRGQGADLDGHARAVEGEGPDRVLAFQPLRAATGGVSRGGSGAPLRARTW